MNKVVHFEIPSDDLDRAKKFYQDTFGWELQDLPEMGYVTATTMPIDENRMPKESGAINGGMMKKNDIVTSPSFAIDVDDVKQAMEKIKASGGILLTEVIPVGDMGLMAYFKDTEGNILSVWQTTRSD